MRYFWLSQCYHDSLPKGNTEMSNIMTSIYRNMFKTYPLHDAIILARHQPEGGSLAHYKTVMM